MKIIPDWLMSAISDGDATNPHTSVGRLIALVVVASCVVCPALIWAYISLWKFTLLEIPGSVIGFMSASGALAASLYSITKYTEKTTP